MTQDTHSEKRNKLSSVLSIHQEGFKKDEIKKELNEYYSLFDDNEASDEKPNLRQQHYQTMTKNFYHLVTDFYEYGMFFAIQLTL